MSKEQNIVIIAGYQATEPATKNFDALVQLVKGKKIQTDGMILVQKDLDGKITVNETGDHLGRKGVAWGGGVGLLVGLVAPVLLAPVVVGAAAGALVGKFAKHKVESGVESGLGEKLKPGMAAILAIVRRRRPPGGPTGDGRLPSQVSGYRRRRPQGRVGRGRRQVQSRPHRAADPRPHLRRDDRPHARHRGGRLDDDPSCETARGRAERPARSHRRRRFRRPRVVRRRHQHAHASRACRRWA